jgi:hypothetical protein
MCNDGSVRPNLDRGRGHRCRSASSKVTSLATVMAMKNCPRTDSRLARLRVEPGSPLYAVLSLNRDPHAAGLFVSDRDAHEFGGQALPRLVWRARAGHDRLRDSRPRREEQASSKPSGEPSLSLAAESTEHWGGSCVQIASFYFQVRKRPMSPGIPPGYSSTSAFSPKPSGLRRSCQNS